MGYIPKEYMVVLAAPPSSGGIGYRSGEGVVREWRGMVSNLLKNIAVYSYV